MGFLIWLEEGALGVWVRESLWGYPIVISCHAVGMAVVIGTCAAYNLRVLGLAREIPVATMDRMFTIAWGGFVLNLVSGCFLFSGDAQRFFFQTVFQIKIGLIILGGISMWFLVRELRGAGETGRSRLIAALSLMCWLGAITAGRLTAYIGA